MDALFSILVQRHWARILSLDISIFCVQWIREETWGFLKQPAPNMRLFSVYLHDGYSKKPNFFSETDMGLFANVAHSLKELRVTRITFDPNASWLAHLRNLDLASPFLLHQLFEVLKNTPFLEMLTLWRKIIDNQESTREISQVILPRLRYINIAHRPETSSCLAVLESIIPRRGVGSKFVISKEKFHCQAPK